MGLRAGDAGDAGQADENGVPELVLRRLQIVCGNHGKSLVNGGVPGMDHVAQRPLGLHRQTASGEVAMSAMVSVTSGGSRLALLAQMFTGISCLMPV